MEVWELPTSIVVGGIDYEIRTDFRAVLDILKTFNDPDFENDEKWIVCLTILYVDFGNMPPQDYEEAIEKAIEFIDMGIKDDGKKQPHVMDWEQDEPILFPAINKVAGREVRALEYMHWWTFMGYFMEIEEGTFSMVLGIRQKRAKGKRLEKWEQDFYRNNRTLCDLKTKHTAEEQAEIEYWNKLLG